MHSRSWLQWRCVIGLSVALFATIGCGGPTGPSTLGPILVCPTPLTVTSIDGNASPVVYEPPQVIEGQPPLRTTCVPVSGSIFQVGASTVTCTTTDSALRTDSCTFTVTVAAPPRLTATSFLAFGNSITEGKLASGAVLSNNYAENLRVLLASRYTSQAVTMTNRGLGGETAVDGARRLRRELDAVRPGVLLLEEGINDLSSGNRSTISPMANALRSMVREAQGRGIAVLLATLPPVRAGSSKGDSAFSLLTEANDQIRSVAASERATLVDLYAGFGGSPDPYIDTDGLHPTVPGYEKIAQLFFDAIRATLEVPPVLSPVFVRNGAAPDVPGATFR